MHRRIYATETGRYGTRMLTAGDPMTVTGPRARALIALGRASDKRPRKAKPQLDHDGDGKPGGSTKQTGGDLPALRAEYEARFGKRPFNGWNAETLREKIATA